jgi:hypothetical protein
MTNKKTLTAIFTWSIEWMQCNPLHENYTNVVTSAGWRCDGNLNGIMGMNYGFCSFLAPIDSFTPYSELTQDQVLEWCYAFGCNKEESETRVQQLIDDQINPPIIQLPMPWNLTTNDI